MKYKNITTYTVIIVAIALIIIGGFIVLSPINTHNNPENNEQKESNKNTPIIEGIIENSSKTITRNYTSSFEELKKISNPKFKVGEKYFYHRWSKLPDSKNILHMPEEYDTVIEVKKIDRINRTNYYVLESKNVSVYSRYLVYKNGVWEKKVPETGITIFGKSENGTPIKEESISTSGHTVYEGCILGVDEVDGEVNLIEMHHTCPVLHEMYFKWMLYLDKGVSWVEKSNVSGFGRDKSNIAVTETEWTVSDVEKINKKDCFKVVVVTKHESMISNEKKISSEIVTYWIDKEKRVLVKMEKREDLVLTETIELKNYESA